MLAGMSVVGVSSTVKACLTFVAACCWCVCVCVFAGTQGIQGVKGDQGAGALRGVPDMGQVAALVGVPRVMFQSTAGV